MSDIEVYKRALEREKKARKDAELLLDEKSRDLYKTIDDLKHTLTELSETQGRLVHTEKMASIGQMAAGIAHEINTPVGFSLSNVNTLKEYIGSFTKFNSFIKSEIQKHPDLSDLISEKREDLDMDFIEEDVDEIVRDAENGLNRVKSIVANLGKVSRPTDGKLEAADINICLKDSIKMVASQIKDVDLETSFEDISPVMTKESELQQVFINMLVNASHACSDTDRKGFIKVSTMNTTKNDQAFVVVIIQDNGKGIAPGNIKKLFNPFFTTKPVGKGTGLGLSISYGIIEQNGGHIEVNSEEDEWTQFSIFLPAEHVC